MVHSKLKNIETLIDAGIPVLLHGERGTGKTTIIKQIAENIGLTFFALSMTRQTTLSHILGFINVTGVYVPTMFRKAVEEGGLFLFDEIDAADPNVIICLNTLENGFVSFPDGIIEVHKDFRIAATANPFDAHNEYTGRAVLDASSLDRFDKIAIPRDPLLESSIVSSEAFERIEALRETLKDANISLYISMRDAVRVHERIKLKLDENYIEETFLHNDSYLIELYRSKKPKILKPQEEIKTVSEMWEHLKQIGESK